MLSDLITDLIRAKTPKEKEAAYRRLEKLGVDRFRVLFVHNGNH